MHGQYRTPKRRHSSLFQRMQEQIQKISRKLSAAKSSARQSSYQKVKSSGRETQRQVKQRVKQGLFQTAELRNPRRNMHFDQHPQSSVVQTVRMKHAGQQNWEQSPLSGKKTVNSKTLNRRLNYASLRQNQEQRINKLEQQNQQLSSQIKKLQIVCSDQSYRLGYASAYFGDKCRKIEDQNEQFRRQNIYLNKLCQHYKYKAIKYKGNLEKITNKRISQSQSGSQYAYQK